MPGELDAEARAGSWATPTTALHRGPEVIVLLCHEHRDEVFALCKARGLQPSRTTELAKLVDGV